MSLLESDDSIELLDDGAGTGVGVDWRLVSRRREQQVDVGGGREKITAG
jgi:hypothetical protein